MAGAVRNANIKSAAQMRGIIGQAPVVQPALSLLNPARLPNILAISGKIKQYQSLIGSSGDG
jgi:hypothetical protein